MRALWGALLVGGCVAVGGEQFSHVPPPATLSPVPHSAAERDQFETFHGPAGNERAARAWREQFLTSRLNRAFAVSPRHYGVGSGFNSAEAALAASLDGCERGRTGSDDPPCVPYAINTEIVYPEAAVMLPFRGRALGPFTPSPEYVYYGPEAAKGLLVWSHGTGGCSDNGARVAAPAIITTLNRGGWDIVRFDRDPCADDLGAALRRMPAGIEAAHRAGYRKVVLAGQSRGAMQSFEILRDPAVAAQVSAVIGFSPAMSGSDVYASTVGPQRWSAIASVLHGPMPAAVFFFGHDPFNPYAPQQVEQTNAAWRTQLPNGHAYFNDSPAMVARTGGHAAATSPAFTARYAGCLQTLIETGAATGPCAE